MLKKLNIIIFIKWYYFYFLLIIAFIQFVHLEWANTIIVSIKSIEKHHRIFIWIRKSICIILHFTCIQFHCCVRIWKCNRKSVPILYVCTREYCMDSHLFSMKHLLFYFFFKSKLSWPFSVANNLYYKTLTGQYWLFSCVRVVYYGISSYRYNT